MKNKLFKPTLTQSDITWLIDSMKLVFATKDELASFKNGSMGKLDLIIGMIKDKRDAQELHAKQHSDIGDRFEKIDKHISFDSSV